MTKQIVKHIKAIWHYYINHIWCGIFSIVLASAVFLIVITKLYLNTQYMDYLMDHTYDAEEKVLQLVNSNMDIMMDEFIQMGCLAATDDDFYDSVDKMKGPEGYVNSNKVANKIRGFTYYSQWIRGVTIADTEEILMQYWRRGNFGFQWTEENAEGLYTVCQSILDKVNNQSRPLYFYAGTSKNEKTGETLFHLAFPIVGIASGNEFNYMVVFSLSEEFFSDSLKLEEQEPLIYGFITDADGKIVYHMDDSLVGTDYLSYVKAAELDVLSARMKLLGWTLHIGIDKAAIRSDVNALYYPGFLLYCVWLACIFVILFVIISRFIRPIRSISRTIDQVKLGDYSEQIVIRGGNEIWQLADEFNSMTRAIERMRTEIEEEHRSHLLAMERMQAAEREALESQINAHFICNTIGAINYEAIEAGNLRVSTMLKKLSNILRYTFDQKHQKVYLEQEISWLEQYLYLQKVRYEDKFEYQIQMPDEARQWPCCKLIFQPFVENSIRHGFEGVEVGGQIRITGRLQGEDILEIQIWDNGNGIPEDVCSAIRQTVSGTKRDASLGIGIANVASRLNYYYGDRAALSLWSEVGKGTVITLVVPREMQI